jgi:hypothetical protein
MNKIKIVLERDRQEIEARIKDFFPEGRESRDEAKDRKEREPEYGPDHRL